MVVSRAENLVVEMVVRWEHSKAVMMVAWKVELMVVHWVVPKVESLAAMWVV
jgi:hypothetical protein